MLDGRQFETYGVKTQFNLTSLDYPIQNIK